MTRSVTGNTVRHDASFGARCIVSNEPDCAHFLGTRIPETVGNVRIERDGVARVKLSLTEANLDVQHARRNHSLFATRVPNVVRRVITARVRRVDHLDEFASCFRRGRETLPPRTRLHL